MVRQLQPWHENVGKRQVKAPKIYLRDTGLLHSLLTLPNHHTLTAHPKMGASWEGFVLEQIILTMRLETAYFWATHQGAEIDLFFIRAGKRFGIEVKYSESPKVTRSALIAMKDLNLTHLWFVYPGRHSYPVDEKISALPLASISQLKEQVEQLCE